MFGDKNYWFGLASGMIVYWALTRFILPRVASSGG